MCSLFISVFLYVYIYTYTYIYIYVLLCLFVFFCLTLFRLWGDIHVRGDVGLPKGGWERLTASPKKLTSQKGQPAEKLTTWIGDCGRTTLCSSKKAEITDK